MELALKYLREGGQRCQEARQRGRDPLQPPRPDAMNRPQNRQGGNCGVRNDRVACPGTDGDPLRTPVGKRFIGNGVVGIAGLTGAELLNSEQLQVATEPRNLNPTGWNCVQVAGKARQRPLSRKPRRVDGIDTRVFIARREPDQSLNQIRKLRCWCHQRTIVIKRGAESFSPKGEKRRSPTLKSNPVRQALRERPAPLVPMRLQYVTRNRLSERSAVGTAGQVDADPEVAALPRPILTRHCWVTGLSECPGRWAGLLAEWRQDTDAATAADARHARRRLPPARLPRPHLIGARPSTLACTGNADDLTEREGLLFHSRR